MPDNKNKTGSSDNDLISLASREDVLYWCESIGCTEEQLRAAVWKAGNSAVLVKEYLGKKKDGELPQFKVRIFVNGVMERAQTVLAGSITSAVKQVCGKGLRRRKRDGILVAIVEDEERKQKVAFYRRSSPRVSS
jgi:hypothetical protein